jgi:hypothetical protein
VPADDPNHFVHRHASCRGRQRCGGRNGISP